MTALTLREIAHRDFARIDASCTPAEALAELDRRQVDCLLLEAQGQAVGWLTRAALTGAGPATRQLERALQRKTALYAALTATNDAIIDVQDRDALFGRICQIVLEQGGFRLAWIGEVPIGGDRILPVAKAGSEDSYLENIVVHASADEPTGRGPSGTAWRTQQAVIINDFLHDTCTAPWHANAQAHGLLSCMALPIVGGGFSGVFTIYAGETDYFDPEIVALLEKMAGDIAFSLDRQRDRREKELAEAELHLHARVFAESTEGMTITDAENRIIQVNHAFTQITGYTLDEVRGDNPRILKSGKHDIGFYEQMWQALNQFGYWQGEIWNRRKSGEIYPQWVTINVVRNEAGQIVNHFAIFSDLTQKRAAAELDRLKRYDALTNLPNRLLLEDRASEAIAHAGEYQRHVALAFVNLDQFHLVNDLFGYVEGDRVLLAIANRLRDQVGLHGTVSRISGDTFAVLLPDLNSPDQMHKIAADLLQQIASPMALGGRELNLTASLGIALWPGDGGHFEALMQCADTAMQHARQQGRNTYRFFTADMNRATERLFQISAEVRAAIAEDRLHLLYQPQIEVSSGRVCGVEALVRIRHPERGLVGPSEFIQAAEETGLIVPMGEWVIRAACRQLRRWHDAGIQDLVLAINLSPLQLRQPNLIEVISAALAESGIEGRQLELELIEGALIRDAKGNLKLLQRLKQLGVRIAIDDFGTGYSSLGHLKQFPVDKLKIDNSFIKHITTDPNDASIVQAIIALAGSLGPTTIAEGVETEAQFNYLRSLRCAQVQGFYFSPPIEAEALPGLLQHQHVAQTGDAAQTILLVDDEDSVLSALKRLLRRQNYRVLTAGSAEEGLEVLAREQVQVVLSDQRMPGMGGVEFLRRVKTMHPTVVRMILSGYSDVGTITEAINSGEVYKFVSKPWENDGLIEIIREAFGRYAAQAPQPPRSA